jgi:WD40 repeat protein
MCSPLLQGHVWQRPLLGRSTTLRRTSLSVRGAKTESKSHVAVLTGKEDRLNGHRANLVFFSVLLLLTLVSQCRNVYVWDENTTRILYSLPGHKGSANSVDFHPNEPVIVSGGSDKKIYLGELHF